MPDILKLNKKDEKNKEKTVGSIEIKNKTEETADLYFFGDIISESWGGLQEFYPDDKAPKDVQDFLDQLDGVEKINVHINSGGGSVFAGIAIYNILKRHNAEIIVYVEGIAASIASVIAMAGDKIIIPENACMMIHKPSCMTWGNAEEIRKQADILDSCQKSILNIYMKHAKDGITEKEIDNLINAETWKYGKEWQEYFDIEVSEKNTAIACASEYFNAYKKTPEALEYSSIEDIKNTEKLKNEERKKEILKDLDYI